MAISSPPTVSADLCSPNGVDMGSKPTIQWLSDADAYEVLASLLLEPVSAKEVLQRIVERAQKDDRVATCSIFLIDGTGEYLKLAATNNPALQAYVSKPTYRLGEGLTGWVGKYRRALLVRDPTDAEECARLADPEQGIPAPKPGGAPFSEGARDGWLAVPITGVDEKECIGVIRVQPRVPWLELTERDLNRLRVVARLTYLVTQNALRLQEEREEAEEEALETLTAKVAHRVGNKLYALANLTEALQLSLDRNPAAAPGLLGQVRETLEATRELVRNLVRQTSLPPLDPRPASLSDLLKTTAGCCVPCQLEPEVSVAPEAETLVCDPEQLRTAIDEIVHNCVQHAGPRAHVKLVATAERGWTTITISDNGPGVAPELKRRIFQPMFTTRADGTGWGLVIAREIVAKHKGAISEVGKPGEGARFVIRLPKGRANAV